MSDNIINLQDYQPIESEEHLQGNAICLQCRHKWQAAAPVGVTYLECPECQIMTGVWYGLLEVPDDIEIWCCNCGGFTFWILRTGCMCIQCGTIQVFKGD